MNRPLRRRVLSAAVALAACTALPFASSSAFAQTAGKPKVALVMKSLANEFFLTMENGAKDYQAHNSSQFDLITNGIKDETDTAAQIRIVEQMIVSKVNALVIAPADSKALVPVIKKAADAGIIVVNIDNRLDPDVLKSKDLNVPFVGPDNRKGAQKVGDYLAKKLKAGDEVGIIEGPSNDLNARQRTLGFKETMNAAGMRIANTASGDWTVASGKSVALQMLYAHPDVRGLLCANDNIAMGAIDAIRIAGKKGRVLVTGYNNIDAVQPMLDDGRLLATVEQFGARQAVFGVDVAVKALLEKRRQRDLSPYMETPVQLVTKAQAKGFRFGAS